MRAFAIVALFYGVVASASACKSNSDCSLNGICTSGACVCDKPWKGVSCGTMGYKVTPAGGKNLYNTSDPRNTWNGPIVTDKNGQYHIFDPIYKEGSLGGPTSILHGVAANVTGPYDWSAQPSLPTGGGENPAFVTFVDPTTGKTVYSLWISGKVRIAATPLGPFVEVPNFKYSGSNPAPIFHNGAWYMTSQTTTDIMTTPSLKAGSTWVEYSTISHDGAPGNISYHTEDPFMWVDKRGNWHIINHAYSNVQYENCGSSYVSAHFFSTDGKAWTWSPDQPYGHKVQYDDGTSHTYTTLERPNIHFDSSGQMTHINLAADLITQDEGCASRTKHAHFGHTPCDNCKWDDHAGTTIIALDV